MKTNQILIEVAGGVIGGIVFLVLFFLLLFWFWLRPRRMRRRRRRREEEEEEKKRRQRQEQELQNNQNHNQNYNILSHPQQQTPYQPIPAGPEPISGRGGVFAPFGGAMTTNNAKTAGPVSPPLPPQGTAASPAELASPTDIDVDAVADGREPAPAQPDYGSKKLRLSSSSPPPRYSTAFPTTMELPSPVDSSIAVANGREPSSSLGTTLDFGTKPSSNIPNDNSNNRVQPAHFHPADQPNPDY